MFYQVMNFFNVFSVKVDLVETKIISHPTPFLFCTKMATAKKLKQKTAQYSLVDSDKPYLSSFWIPFKWIMIILCKPYMVKLKLSVPF